MRQPITAIQIYARILKSVSMIISIGQIFIYAFVLLVTEDEIVRMRLVGARKKLYHAKEEEIVLIF